MLERDIESWSSRKARDAGWWNRKFTSPGNRSVPDRIFGKGGRVFWVEFKATGKVPTELQKEEHALMRKHGLTVYWTDSRDGFDWILAHENYAALEEWSTWPGNGVTGDRPAMKFYKL